MPERPRESLKPTQSLDIDFDAFAEQLDLIVDKLFSSPAKSTAEAESGAEAPRTALQGRLPLHRSVSDSTSACTPLKDGESPPESSLSAWPQSQSPVGTQHLDVDFDALEEHINTEIEKLFGPTSGPIKRYEPPHEPPSCPDGDQFVFPEAPEPSAPSESEQTLNLSTLDTTPEPLDDLFGSEPVEPIFDGSDEVLLDGLQEAAEVLILDDAEIIYEELSSPIQPVDRPESQYPAPVDGESGAEKTLLSSRPAAESLPGKPFSAVSVGITEAAQNDPAWPDYRTAVPSPSLEEEASSAEKEAFTVPITDHAPSTSEDEPDELAKLIETMSAAYLALEWDYSVRNVEELHSAITELGPQCRQIHEADSIATVLRAILQRLKHHPDSVSTPLMNFISSGFSFLLSLLRSKTAPGQAERAELNRLMEDLWAIRAMRPSHSTESIIEQPPVASIDSRSEPSTHIEAPSSTNMEALSPDTAAEPLLDDSEASQPGPNVHEEPHDDIFLELGNEAHHPVAILEAPDPGPITGEAHPRTPTFEEIARLIEAVDVAFVTLEWDFSVENTLTLEQTVFGIEPHFEHHPEATGILSVVKALLQHLKTLQAAPAPALMSFLSESVDFLKASLTAHLEPQEQIEHSRELLARLRALDSHIQAPDEALDLAASLGAKLQPPSAQAMQAFDSLDIAFACLSWNPALESIALLDHAILDAGLLSPGNRVADSIVRILRAVLQRSKGSPELMSSSLLALIADALDCIKLHIRAGSEGEESGANCLKQLIERLRTIRTEQEESLSCEAELDDADVQTPGTPDTREEPVLPAAMEEAYLQMLQEIRSWSTSWETGLGHNTANIELELERILQLAEILSRKEAFAPITSRLLRLGNALSEHIRLCRSEDQEWTRRLSRLEDWEKMLIGETALPPDHLQPSPDLREEPPLPECVLELVEGERAVEDKSQSRQQVYVFELSQQLVALPASNVMKFVTFSESRERRIYGRGYATLSDFKPFFKPIGSDLLGEWKRLPARLLKTFRFIPVSESAWRSVADLQSPSGSPAPGQLPEPPSVSRGVILFSDTRVCGMINTTSEGLDLRDVEIVQDAASDHGLLLGEIVTEESLTIPVIKPDSLLASVL